jgi:hypothetical protein
MAPLSYHFDKLIAGLIASAGTVTAAIYDINWGAAAGAITGLSMAVGGGIYFISERKTKAYSLAKAAEVEAYRESELAKLEVQKQRDEANKESLSAKLDQIQRSSDEMNHQLQDARNVAATSAQLLAAQKEISDATLAIAKSTNDKLHRIINELTVKSLQKDAEILDLRHKLDAASAELGCTNRNQLTEIDRTHTLAINGNATNTEAIASRIGMQLPVPIPHVEPMGSTDEMRSFPPSTPGSPGDHR